MIPALDGVVDVGDLAAAFHAVDADRAAAIARLLGGLATHSGPPQLDFTFQQRRPAGPRRRPSYAYENARVWHRDNELVVHLDETPAGARMTPDRAWIGGATTELDRAWQLLFHFAVTHLLAHHHRYVLHAAGLVTEDGEAFVVLGESGQGKSTLALAALASGWRLLSDDLVILRSGTFGLEASGIARRLAVPGDLGADLNVTGRPIPDDHRGRTELNVDQLSRGWFPVAGVIVVGHSTAPDGELRALCAEQTMYRALGAFSSVTDPVLLTMFFPVAGSLCRLPRWHFGHGVDAHTRLGAAQRLLEQLTAP